MRFDPIMGINPAQNAAIMVSSPDPFSPKSATLMVSISKNHLGSADRRYTLSLIHI